MTPPLTRTVDAVFSSVESVEVVSSLTLYAKSRSLFGGTPNEFCRWNWLRLALIVPVIPPLEKDAVDTKLCCVSCLVNLAEVEGRRDQSLWFALLASPPTNYISSAGEMDSREISTYFSLMTRPEETCLFKGSLGSLIRERTYVSLQSQFRIKRGRRVKIRTKGPLFSRILFLNSKKR